MSRDRLLIDSILQPFQQFGMNMGLERVTKLLASLGNPQQKFPIIHVAGTNGKGSVCAYLSAILTEAGYRVGRYTSPHLIDWTERICINEKPITLTRFYQLLDQVIKSIAPDAPTPTKFEIVTAAAWLYFAEEGVDLAVIEVGLGGRLDATNVCDRPLVSVITSISRDHWQILGSTLGEIAGEKAGILKPGSPAVIGELPLEAKNVVAQRIEALNCPVIWVKPAQRVSAEWVEYESRPLVLAGETPAVAFSAWASHIRYPLPLLGDFQLMNSAIALASIQVIQQQGYHISLKAIQDGMRKTQWPGRLQWVNYALTTSLSTSLTTSEHQPSQLATHSILIDGAHNVGAAIVLREFVDSLPSVTEYGVTWVIGMLNTKDHADIFRALLRKGDRLYLVPVPDEDIDVSKGLWSDQSPHGSADPAKLASLALHICPELASCQVFADVVSGLNSGLNRAIASDHHQPVILCGSLYLIGYFLSINIDKRIA